MQDIEKDFVVMKCKRCRQRCSHTIHGFHLYNRRYKCTNCGKEMDDALNER